MINILYLHVTRTIWFHMSISLPTTCCHHIKGPPDMYKRSWKKHWTNVLKKKLLKEKQKTFINAWKRKIKQTAIVQ